MTASATLPDAYLDLLDAPGVAALATVGADGRPQVTAVWYLRDGDVVRTSMVTTRQKYKNLRRHPLATLFVIDPANPYRTLEVRADATFEEDSYLAFLDRLVQRYGMTLDTFPGEKEDRWVVTLTPRHVVTYG